MDPQQLRFIDIPSPFAFRPGVIRALAPVGATRDEILSELLDGDGDKPFVLDTGTHRALHFDLIYMQSAMRMSDPNALELPYTRYMMAFLMFNRAPRHIAMLGLGGGSLAKYCYRHLPDAAITAVEANPQVIAFREQFLLPGDDSRFRVICADGLDYVKAAEHIDVLLIDAYNDVGLPPTLFAAAFFEQVRRSLAPDGIAVMNLAGSRRERGECLKMLKQVFAEQVIAIPVQDDGNHVAFAFNAENALAGLAHHANHAAELTDSLDLPFALILKRMLASARRLKDRQQ
ncbi:MAG: fused MFS/spermidine synthase [Sulfuricella sp.]|nr:fused MFS/spermidine synthase [Sulfuricella sp.]